MKWRAAFLAAAVLLAVSLAVPAFAAESGGQLDDCIHLWIRDMVVRPGEDIDVEVHISNVTGWGVMAFEGKICWCDIPAGLLQYERCRPGPVIRDSGWNMGACGECEDNCITFAAAGTQPLQGEGVFKILTFHVSANAKPCMCCSLWFDYMYLYDPEQPLNVCLEGGEVCIEHCDVYGMISAWFCYYDCGRQYYCFPLEGARVHLSECGDGPVATTYTNSKGMFAFECLWPHDDQVLVDDCGYCVEVDYCRMPDAAVTSYDAALILKYLVCMESLTRCPLPGCGSLDESGGSVYPQRIAADVNCTGAITAYDASLILQYVVGLLPAFPCPDPWVWISLNCTWCSTNCPARFEIIGIYKGDVSGKSCPDQDAVLPSPAVMKLGIPRHDGDFVEIPVLVQGADEVYSVQFDLEYNHSALTLVDVRTAGLTTGYTSVYNEIGGVLKVAMAGAESFDGQGRVAVVRFAKTGGRIPVASARVAIVDALLNETTPVIEGRTFDAEIVSFGLGPVSPNPFTEGTVIRYTAPRASQVSLAIYNVNGQLVRTVHDGYVEAGTHSVAWDGSDSNGVKVARGVYFCHMNTDGFSATEKVVLLQ